MNRKKIQLIIIILATFLAYSNIFQNEFVIDDETFIAGWEQGKSLLSIGDFFKGALPAGHEGVYRPIRSLLYAFYYQVWGINPFGYHLHSLLVQVLSTVLVYLIIEQLTKKKTPAFIGGLLFGLHPVHTESITYISASMEMTGAVFALTSFLLYIKSPKLLISLFFALLAFFTYEMTLTLPLLILAYGFCFQKLKWRRILPYFLALLGYILIRIVIVKTIVRGELLANSFYLSVLASVKVIGQYLLLLVWPVNLTHNHIVPQGVEAILYRGHVMENVTGQSLLDLPALFSLFVIFALFWLTFKFIRKQPIISFAILIFFITLLPALPVIPQWSLMHEKFLYLPSIGLAAVAGSMLSRLFYKYRLFTALLLIFLTVFLGSLTFLRNRDWHDSIALWSKDIKRNPDANAYAYFQLGEAYLKEGKKDQAIASYKQAFEINPYFAVAAGSAARTYADLGDVALAVEYYQEAVQADQNFWEGRFNLGNIYRNLGKLDLAGEEYRKVLLINPGFEPAAVNLKIIYD